MIINRKGKTVKDRLNEDIEYARNTVNIKHRELLALKALGAADLAVEFGLITYIEWEKYIESIFKIA